MLRRLMIAAAASLLGGCSMLGGLFSSKSNLEPPAPLVDFRPTLVVKQVWRHDIGSGSGDLALRLQPAVNGDTVFAAGPKGELGAWRLSDGTPLWRTRVKAQFSSGPGYGEGIVVLGTTQGELLAFDAASGKRRWRARVTSEVLSIPVVRAGKVVVRTIDGRVAAFDARSGKRSWLYIRREPLLSLRGTSSPVVAGDTVLNGFDNGMLVAMKIGDGKPVWEKRIALPTGRSELQRLVDIDADPVIMGDTAYVGTYQGKVAAVVIETGELVWTRKISTYAGLAADSRRIFITDEDSEIWALDRRNGASMWRQKKLHARRVTAPVLFAGYLVVGDYAGYLHWMSPADGHFVARVRADSKGIAMRPVVAGRYLVVLGKSGELGVYTIGR